MKRRGEHMAMNAFVFRWVLSPIVVDRHGLIANPERMPIFSERSHSVSADLRRRRGSIDQIDHCWMIQMRTDDTLQRRMDLGQQTADAITGLCDLPGEIVIETTQHCEFSDVMSASFSERNVCGRVRAACRTRFVR